MNKTIFITGASSGIGKATAKFFQSKGWNVVATMRSPEKEKELTSLDNILVAKLDVLDLESIDLAIQKAIETFSKIDVLLNNAGYGINGPLEAFPHENIVKHFHTNVIGLLDVTKAVIPHFRQNKSGTIINISSTAGKVTYPFISLYNGSKFAVEGISESLSFEMAAISVKVKIIEPGQIDTDFMGRSMDVQNKEDLKPYQKALEKQKELSKQTFDPEKISSPTMVAEVIYEAATDNSDQLRYQAGADAIKEIANRANTNDQTYLRERKKALGLEEE
ncbi:MAG: SDR family oxidoreductase [Christiangramia sp.]|mgnify:CR=1 FL=1|tara:strand:- start:520 stop:1350 length:831 start_codon:yes stop_codon:yes gene_type:complete